MNKYTKIAIETILKSDSSISEGQRAAGLLALETTPSQNAVVEIGGVILPDKEKPAAADALLEKWKRAFGNLEAEAETENDSALVPTAIAVFKAIPVGIPFVRGDKLEELVKESGVPVPPTKKYWVRDRVSILIEAGLLRKCGRASHAVKLIKDSEYSDEMDKAIREANSRLDRARHGKKAVNLPQTPDGIPLGATE